MEDTDKDLESLQISQIKAVRHTQDNGRVTINPNDHYEVVSFGKVIDANNDLMPMESLYGGIWAREKELVHVIGGFRQTIKEKRV